MTPSIMSSLFALSVLAAPVGGQTLSRTTRVVVPSDGWELVGDLVVPASDRALPGVLMLNGAAGDRHVYRELAVELAHRGIASLRLDLRGHGESTNQGRFVPGAEPRSSLIWDAEADVDAALQFLRQHVEINAGSVGVVGASYSGEEMAEAGRLFGYAQAYVALSPGSFSAASVTGLDASGVPWLFVVSRDERFLREITGAVQAQSERVHVEILPGTGHAARLLELHASLAERLAVWLTAQLSGRPEE